jgi:hypothetical protein
MSVRMRLRLLLFVASALAVAPAPAALHAGGPLPPVTGPALAGPTHLHLVISGSPPYIYDVDAGRVRALATVAGTLDSWVRPSGNGAFVSRWGCCRSRAASYRIERDGSVQRLAAGGSMAPAFRSSAIWRLRRGADGTCRLELLPSSRRPVAAPCAPLWGAAEGGVLMWTSTGLRLVDARTGQVGEQAAVIVPLGGGLVFEETGDGSQGQGPLRLVDLATGARRTVGRPSILRGLDEVVPAPHSHLVAVGFADPAYPGPAQALDVWILDTASGRYTHLPGMPAQVDLKFSSMAWAPDDRLVLLLQGGGRTVVGVWRPGARELPLRVVDLPEHTGGSDAFVPLLGP